MSFRKEITGTLWHWCRNCPGWPQLAFQQREDKPATWGGESLCEECDRRERSSSCNHSAELRIGRESDRVLGPISYR